MITFQSYLQMNVKVVVVLVLQVGQRLRVLNLILFSNMNKVFINHVY